MKRSYMKLLSFIPSVVMMVLIYWFSAQTASVSSQLSSGFTLRLIRSVDSFFHLNLTEPQTFVLLEQLHGLVRKVAHFSEYFLLSLTVFLPFYVYKKRTKKFLYITIVICCLYACTDELHQMFSDGRACQIRDIVIDTCGSAFAMLFYHIVKRFR